MKNITIYYYWVSILLCSIISVNVTNILLDINKETEQESIDKYIEEGYLEDEIFDDVKYFPIALPESMKDDINYDNSYGNPRTYGGERIHEGIDIFTKDNIRGQFPIVSVCDGKVEKMGWLELGGYRIGIRSETGVYYYYAHLFRFDEEISVGAEVSAGQIIGYIGDTGYSKVEGTTGNFPVHLHFGIYINSENVEFTVNPFLLLNKLKNNILIYDF